VWDVATGTPLTDEIRSDESVPWVWFTVDRSVVGSRLWVVVGGSRLWALQVVDGPVPPWLPELAEAVVGMRFREQSGAEPAPENGFFRKVPV
jgi:hypothetical protein